jgi:hypothetical protein
MRIKKLKKLKTKISKVEAAHKRDEQFAEG